jgi:thioredoxin-related protein
VYSNVGVRDFIGDNFVPVRVHVKDNRDEWESLGSRYGVRWTPTILIVDGEGSEHRRIEGFLPADQFMGQLALGVAHETFNRKDYPAAERLFNAVLNRFPQTEAGPEAMYWAGVSRFERNKEAAALTSTAVSLKERYPASLWATKASVWDS